MSVTAGGVATAAGCQLVAACDLAVASTRATFATPGVRIGLFCSTPMVALTRAIGRKRAMSACLQHRHELVPAATAMGAAVDEDEPGFHAIAPAQVVNRTAGDLDEVVGRLVAAGLGDVVLFGVEGGAGASAKSPRLWLLALAAGVIVGLTSWGVEEVGLLVFAPTYQLEKEHRVTTPAAGAEMDRPP